MNENGDGNLDPSAESTAVNGTRSLSAGDVVDIEIGNGYAQIKCDAIDYLHSVGEPISGTSLSNYQFSSYVRDFSGEFSPLKVKLTYFGEAANAPT